VRLIHDPTAGVAVSGDLVTQVADELAAHLDLRACWFEPFPFDTLLPRIEPGRIVVPAAEPGIRPYFEWQASDGVELPVRYEALTLGRFVLVPQVSTCGVALGLDARKSAIAVARLVGNELVRRWTGTDPRASAEREAPSWPMSCS
jgi:hypothetical protein